MSAGYRVRLDGIRKSYGQVAALGGVSMDVGPGRFVVLLGPSGSGKSTLARVLAGIERVDAGRIQLGELVVDDGRRQLPPERRDLAMVFQDYALWPHMTATANVAYALRRRRLDKGAARQRAVAALDRVGLARLAARYPHELSGGEQQRVALARAIVAEPGLLLFDEPLSNLDADLRERLRVEIATLTREIGATAVYITHDQAEAFALADAVGVLERGQLVQFGPPEEVYRRPANPFVARFTGVAAEFDGRIAWTSGSRVVVDIAGRRIPGRCQVKVCVGAPVQVLLRPPAVRIAPPPVCLHDADDEAVDDDELGSLPGVVVDVAYRGRGYEHVVESPCGPIAGIFDTRPHARGSQVRVLLAAEGCMAYPGGGVREGHGRYDVKLTTVTDVRDPHLVLEGGNA